ncbi:hypothetical protein V6N13_064798 [Hibiscus sabdariffa]|uniref:Uncharacterized protein n=1 Tax=Hibiscus sabdariffa TaxID=183260 RepID=A0ABR2ECM3_9ROSI
MGTLGGLTSFLEPNETLALGKFVDGWTTFEEDHSLGLVLLYFSKLCLLWISSTMTFHLGGRYLPHHFFKFCSFWLTGDSCQICKRLWEFSVKPIVHLRPQMVKMAGTLQSITDVKLEVKRSNVLKFEPVTAG